MTGPSADGDGDLSDAVWAAIPERRFLNSVSGQAHPWDGPGIRTAGAEQADTWTLEVAIPFTDLGAAPTPGRAWRFNACRTEQPSGEYTCWSPTRGGYHLTERFGYLEFGAQAEDAAGDEARTYYSIRGTEVTAEWVRLCNGYWLWRSPIKAHTPWIYYAYGNSAFDDLDSPRRTRANPRWSRHWSGRFSGKAGTTCGT